ncbi:disulfide bond formation protein B [Chitinivorax sp. B]|uniref:disulfide bond formation protein B n=1 Tax=Chitinivorax sp. B TaxID=2502235 RepID=UPI0010F796C4|nr:disulfide bond formation protein B [Chitinivorax sp. B]
MLLKLIPSRRLGNALGFLFCAGLIGYALYLQYFQFQVPCPLCILQRVAVIAMGVMFLLAAVFHPKGKLGAKLWAALIMLPGLVGLGIAGRHVYIQNLPPELVPSCGPGLEFMLETMPWSAALAKVLHGSGECAEAGWRFLGLTIPSWTMVCFAGLIVYTLLVVYKDLKRMSN